MLPSLLQSTRSILKIYNKTCPKLRTGLIIIILIKTLSSQLYSQGLKLNTVFFAEFDEVLRAIFRTEFLSEDRTEFVSCAMTQSQLNKETS